MSVQCNICGSGVGSLRISPQHNGKPKHSQDERACDQCWEAWLSLQVEENQPDQIECMFCNSMLDAEQIKSFGREGTWKRYNDKPKPGMICMDRCTHSLQPFDRETDGRVFACSDCGYQTCVDCDRPEHKNESCLEYRARMDTVHARAEQMTHGNFDSCPSCDMLFDKEGCGFIVCEHCKYRFCSRCMAPWVGERSAYLWGKEAHGEGCLYRTRDAPSKHSLGNRFRETDEVETRIEERKLANKLKLEARKATGATKTSKVAKATKITKATKQTKAKKTKKVKDEVSAL